ncbi:unannotated protein [freshwater metagenome]|jgi:uncharacterized protein YggU (UPF0235/DUF167 family)|uniref:Unannotated protein n=1 Tax=freshwater metagenome TaxID=449393 RepID=A0A6J7LYG4_9ZZZZ
MAACHFAGDAASSGAGAVPPWAHVLSAPAIVETLRVVIRVKPGASRSAVGGSHGDPPALVVAVHAQPVDGKANEAVVITLADALGLKARHISVVGGHTSRTKHVEIDSPDVGDAVLTARISALMAPRQPARKPPAIPD